MTAVVDYNAGNVFSVLCALERLGEKAEVTSDRERILSADRVIFPGVGYAVSAMEELEKRGLADVLTSVKCPFLGICLGMQLMCSFSEEGNTGMLSIVDADVRRFDPSICPKIPHIGWNTAYDLKGPLFEGIKDGSYFFFDHSYYVPLLGRATSAVTSYYGFGYTSALERDNFFGVQFHPEKSGKAGSILLENFLNMEI